jgi:hypothetical protein
MHNQTGKLLPFNASEYVNEEHTSCRWSGERRLRHFRGNGFGSLTSGLVYDPSGEIALPPNQRSKSWTDGPGATELGIDKLEVHHIFGPYYHWFHD